MSVRATDDVRLLLACYLDALPSLVAGSAEARGKAGEAPTNKATCPACRGKGVDRFRRPCPNCYDEERGRSRGWVWTDGYTGRQVATVDQDAPTAPARTRRVTCDACGGQGAFGNHKRCRYCDGAGYVLVHVLPSSSGEPVTNPSDALAIAAQACKARISQTLWDRGSFAELSAALAELAAWKRRLVWDAYVTASFPPAQMSERQRENTVDALRELARDVERRCRPERVRVPRELREWWADENLQARIAARPVTGSGWLGGRGGLERRGIRNTEIRKRFAAGETAGHLAREYGLTKRRVEQIVAELRAFAQRLDR